MTPPQKKRMKVGATTRTRASPKDLQLEIRTKLPAAQYADFEAYATRENLSEYKAARRLILAALAALHDRGEAPRAWPRVVTRADLADHSEAPGAPRPGPQNQSGPAV